MHDDTFDTPAVNKKRPTPYDTGKLKIGLYYEPPLPTQDEDAIALQDALLGGKWAPSATAKTKWQTLILAAIGVGLYVFGLSLILR